MLRRLSALVISVAVVAGGVAPTLGAVDVIAPTVSGPVLSLDAAVQNRSVKLSVTATDPSRISDVEYRWDTAPWMPMHPVDGAFGGTTEAATVVAPGREAQVVDVAVGSQHACAALADGSAWCWGAATNGALGIGLYDDGSLPVRLYPVRAAGISGAVAVAADHTTNTGYSCALLGHGGAMCWGNGTLLPTVVPGVADAVGLDVSGASACAVSSTGAVSCWSGLGAPTPVAGLPEAVEISGDCAVTADTEVWCGLRSTPSRFGGTLTGVHHLSTGGSHRCALLQDSTVMCWGANDFGQLGDGTTTSRAEPVAVLAASGEPLTGVVDVGAEGGGSCAVMGDGTSWCWGSSATFDASGRLAGSSVPVLRPGVSRGHAIAGNGATWCVTDVAGSLVCWGSGNVGQLGDGSSLGINPDVSGAPPVTVAMDGIGSIATSGAHTCAADAGGQVWCWGADSGLGMVGAGPVKSYWPYPHAAVAGVAGATRVSVGSYGSCALLATGGISCWGQYPGDGSGSATTAVAVSGIGADSVAAIGVARGNQSACALLADGAVVCWGANGSGQLGDGTTTGSGVPVAALGIGGDNPHATSIAISPGLEGQVCALLDGGAVACWGAGTLVPTTVAGMDDAVDLAATGAGVCAVRSAGTVACWSGMDATGATLVPGLTGVVAIAAGGSVGNPFMCAVLDTGRVMCWGYNNFWVLGNGPHAASGAPLLVPGVAGAVDVTAGMENVACAQLVDGTARCWGDARSSALGDGSYSISRGFAAPVRGLPGPLSVGDHLLCVRATDAAGNRSGETDCTTLTVEPPDLEAPGVSSFTSAEASPTSGVSPEFTLALTEPVSGVGPLDFANAGSATGCTFAPDAGAGATITVQVTGCSATGTLQPRLLAGSVADPSDNAGPAADVDASTTLVLDREAPVFDTATGVSIRTGLGLATAAATSVVPVAVGWAATDVQGAVSYTLARSINGGAWAAVALPSTATTSLATTVPSTGTVAFRATACDNAGNCTNSETGTLRASIVQQSSAAVTWTGAWTAGTGATFSGGSTRYATARGASATFRVTGRSVALVTQRAPASGYAWIYVDGAVTPAAKVSLTRSPAQPRFIAWQMTWATSGTHTIRVWVAGTAGKPRVDVDAFVVIK